MKRHHRPEVLSDLQLTDAEIGLLRRELPEGMRTPLLRRDAETITATTAAFRKAAALYAARAEAFETYKRMKEAERAVDQIEGEETTIAGVRRENAELRRDNAVLQAAAHKERERSLALQAAPHMEIHAAGTGR